MVGRNVKECMPTITISETWIGIGKGTRIRVGNYLHDAVADNVDRIRWYTQKQTEEYFEC